MAEERIAEIVVPLRYEYKDAGLREMASDIEKFSSKTGMVDILKGFNKLSATFSNTKNSFSKDSPKIVASINATSKAFSKATLQAEKYKSAFVSLAYAQIKGASNEEIASLTEKVNTAWQNLSKTLNVVATNYQNLLTEEDKFRANKIDEEVRKRKQEWQSLGDTFKKVPQKFRQSIQSLASALYVLRRLTNFVKSMAKEIADLINASSSWVENLNLLEVVFGDVSKNAETTKKWVSELAHRFSMDKNAIVQYVSTFKQMANAMGQASVTGETMSKVLVQLGLDIASLRNVKTETAMSDLASAIAGQIKPVRKYGFDVTQQSINALLQESGIGGTVTTLSQADKQLARTILLVRQSRDAWGDLGKTINTFANQQRIMTDQFETTKRLLGQVFLGTFQFGDTLDKASQTAGIATKVIWHINAALIMFNDILESILPSAESVNGGIAAFSDNAQEDIEDVNDAINGTLASFDKFNVMSSGAASSLTGTTLEGLFNQEAAKYLEEFRERSQQVKQYSREIADSWLGEIFPAFKEWKGDDVTKTFAQWAENNEEAKDAIAGWVQPFKNFASTLGDSLTKILKDLPKYLKAIGELVIGILNFIKPIAQVLVNISINLGADGIAKALKAIFWILVSIKGIKIISGAISGINTIAKNLGTLLAPAITNISSKLADLSNGFKVIRAGSLDIAETTAPKMETAIKGIGKGFIAAAAGAAVLSAGLAVFNSFSDNMSEESKKIIKIVAGVSAAIIGIGVAIAVAAHAATTLGMDIAGAIAKGVLFGAGAAMAVAGVTMGAGALIASAANKYAQGGYQTGGLFYAGENGAEWVGRQGNTSTIVNDKQMSDIMQQSVAMGVIQGNRMSGGGRTTAGDNKPIVVNVDGKRLFEVVEQNGKKVGKVFVGA